MAIYLANKKHNVYLYELALMLLIPSSLLIFLLPASLKEMGIVLALGTLFIFAIWFIFSNFYLPKLSYLGEDKESWLISLKSTKADGLRATHSYSGIVKEMRATGKKDQIKEEVRKRRASLAPLNFAPVIFLLGFIGFILWLSNYELNYPNFFKSNKLLSMDKSLQSQINTVLNSLKGNYKELKDVPEVAKEKLSNGSPNLMYYLFPGNLDLKTLIEKLGENGTSGGGGSIKNWSIQLTNAFSIMPSLEKSVSLIFFSLAPLAIYNLFRFGLANSISLILSSLMFFGVSFLILFSGFFIKVPELFPELILSAFFVLLGFWNKSVLCAKQESKMVPEEQKNKKNAFQYQSWGIKSELKKENNFYFLALLGIMTIAWSLENQELINSFALFLFLVFGICIFFVPTLTSLWANINLLKDRYYYHLVGLFVRQKNRLREVGTEEENVLGINY